MLIDSDIKSKKGSKIIFDTLKNLGVDTIFGYPGGIVLDLYNEIFENSGIKHILTRHEQAAVHAAEGYAKETGKCGVVLVTSGPGATNTVSGFVNAYLDGCPIVVITGQVYSNLLGKNAFQEANICDIVKSCTKKVYQLKSATEIQSTFREAFSIANSGKKGPVVIDIPKDVFEQKTEVETAQNQILSADLTPQSQPNIDRFISLLNSATKPVIVAGGGVNQAKAEQELRKFAQRFSIPVVNTMMGLGSYPQDCENYFGMVGIFGDNSANEIVKSSDLVISLGARFNDRILCKFKDIDLASKFVQIDINEAEISNFVKASDYFVADVKVFLNALLKVSDKIMSNFSEWRKSAQSLKEKNVKRACKTNLLHSFEVLRKIEDFTKGKNVTFTSEVGQHQLWAVQNLRFNEDRKIFVSGGAGTMGFGLPAAIGAAIASPNKDIVCIAGDGSFQMNLPELATCKDYGLNVKIMILDNGYLGMVRQLQEKNFDGKYSETKISNPDFVTLAKSYNIPATRVTNVAEIETALAKAFSTKDSYLIDFAVEPMETL